MENHYIHELHRPICIAIDLVDEHNIHHYYKAVERIKQTWLYLLAYLLLFS